MPQRGAFPEGDRERLNTPSQAARWLAAAAVFHVAVTLAIYSAGRHGLCPDLLDADGTLARSDCVHYGPQMASLVRRLAGHGLTDWLAASSSFHVRLYSLCLAVFGPWFGPGILGVEPLNLLCYLAILMLVFHLGREVFDRRAGLLAAGAVALWPSFVVHTTQLFKDPMFIAATLALLLVQVRWLTRVYPLGRGVAVGAAAGSAGVLLWLLRGNWSKLVLAVVCLGFGLLIVRQLWQRRLLVGNMAGMLLLLAVFLGLPRANPVAGLPQDWGGQVASLRGRMITYYGNGGSTVDTDAVPVGMADLVRSAPRAALLGFLAPFPDRWFVAGRKVPLAGRLLAGLEMVVLYLVEGVALCGVWRGRHRLSAWYLLLVAVLSVTTLALVMPNLGALYRMRYVFGMLLLVLGAGGASQVHARVPCFRGLQR